MESIFVPLPLDELPGSRDTAIFISPSPDPIVASSEYLTGSFFAEKLSPTPQFRIRRRKRFAQAAQYKYILDLTPATEDDSAIELVEALWCPDEVTSWRASDACGCLYEEPDDGIEGLPELSELREWWAGADRRRKSGQQNKTWEVGASSGLLDRAQEVGPKVQRGFDVPGDDTVTEGRQEQEQSPTFGAQSVSLKTDVGFLGNELKEKATEGSDQGSEETTIHGVSITKAPSHHATNGESVLGAKAEGSPSSSEASPSPQPVVTTRSIPNETVDDRTSECAAARPRTAEPIDLPIQVPRLPESDSLACSPSPEMPSPITTCSSSFQRTLPTSPMPPRLPSFTPPPAYTIPRHTAALKRIILILHNQDPQIRGATMWYTVHRLSMHLGLVQQVADYTFRWLFAGSNLTFVELHAPFCLEVAEQIQSPALYERAFSLLVARTLLYDLPAPNDNPLICGAAKAMSARLQRTWLHLSSFKWLDPSLTARHDPQDLEVFISSVFGPEIDEILAGASLPPQAPPDPHPSFDRETWDEYRFSISAEIPLCRKNLSRYTWLCLRDLNACVAARLRAKEYGWIEEFGYWDFWHVYELLNREVEECGVLKDDEGAAVDFQLITALSATEKAWMPIWAGGNEGREEGEGKEEGDGEKEEKAVLKVEVRDVPPPASSRSQSPPPPYKQEDDNYEALSPTGSDFTVVSSLDSEGVLIEKADADEEDHEWEFEYLVGD